MVALLDPTASQTHRSSLDPDPTFRRPRTPAPPRSGPEARPRVGPRGRANLALVVDNTMVDNTTVGDRAVTSARSQDRRTPIEQLRDLAATPVADLAPSSRFLAGVEYSLASAAAFALVPLLLISCLWFVPGGATVSGDDPGAIVSGYPDAEIVRVGSGDTLWSLAGELAPDRDRREVMAILSEANGGPDVQAGQRLVVPREVAG